ncbi:hypothetical protein ACFQ7Z_26790 [Streptomyces virginiae]|uniref:hypothetical protein n=1 Tax=Streptomyces virginiae TaxID=1961 RepID=UPI00369DB9EA
MTMPRTRRWVVALAVGATALCAVPAATAATAQTLPAAAANPVPESTVTIDQNPVTHGTTFHVSATGFDPGEEVYVRLIPRGREDLVRGGGGDGDHSSGILRSGREIVVLAILLAQADGSVSADVTIPDRNKRPRIFGEYLLELAGHRSQIWQTVRITVLPSLTLPDGRPSKDKEPTGNPGDEGAQKPGERPGKHAHEGPDPSEGSGEDNHDQSGPSEDGGENR